MMPVESYLQTLSQELAALVFEMEILPRLFILQINNIAAQ